MDISVVSILMERAETFARSFIAWSPNIIAALAILLLTWLASRLVGWISHRVSGLSKFRPALQEAIYSLSKVVIWLTGIVIAMTIALPGLSPSEVFAGAGIASLAVGLAFKDIFENYVAGLLIMLRPAMRTGDYIECENVKGRVERITIRDTYLRDVDGVLTMVPNAFLYKNAVNVLTDEDLRRHELVVGVAYGEDVDAARAVISNAMANVEMPRTADAPRVLATSFSRSSIDFDVIWWSRSEPMAIRVSRDEAVRTIKRALDDAGIEIPFPYRTLTFKDTTADGAAKVAIQGLNGQHADGDGRGGDAAAANNDGYGYRA